MLLTPDTSTRGTPVCLAGQRSVFPTLALATSSELNRAVTDPGDHPRETMTSLADVLNRRHAHQRTGTANASGTMTGERTYHHQPTGRAPPVA